MVYARSLRCCGPLAALCLCPVPPRSETTRHHGACCGIDGDAAVGCDRDACAVEGGGAPYILLARHGARLRSWRQLLLMQSRCAARVWPLGHARYMLFILFSGAQAGARCWQRCCVHWAALLAAAQHSALRPVTPAPRPTCTPTTSYFSEQHAVAAVAAVAALHFAERRSSAQPQHENYSRTAWYAPWLFVRHQKKPQAPQVRPCATADAGAAHCFAARYGIFAGLARAPRPTGSPQRARALGTPRGRAERPS